MTLAVTALALVLAVAADQIIKYAVTPHHERVLVRELIPGFLRLRYVENSGAIFGSFANYTIVLTVFSVALIAVTLWFIFSKKVGSRYVYICLVLMASGGIGNIIDRIRLGYVIDYIEPLFVDFAVFNFADCLITVGAFMLIGYLLKDIFTSPKKQDEIPQHDGEEAHGE